jgi:hypothetical protein
MATDKLSDQQWVDIVLPQAVPTGDMQAWLLLATGTFLTVFLAIRFVLNRPDIKARRRLRQLYKRTAIDDSLRRNYCARIAAELRAALGVPRLAVIRFSQDRQGQWQEFLQQLERYRYGPATPSPAEIKQLAKEATYWLGQKSWKG